MEYKWTVLINTTLGIVMSSIFSYLRGGRYVYEEEAHRLRLRGDGQR